MQLNAMDSSLTYETSWVNRQAMSPSATSKSFLTLQHDGFCDSLQYYSAFYNLQFYSAFWMLFQTFVWAWTVDCPSTCGALQAPFFATNTDPFGLRIVEGCWCWQPIKRAICRVPILFGRGSKSFVLIRDSWQIISRSTRHLTCKRHIYKQDQASIILTLAGMICAICHIVFKHTCDLIQILCGWNAIWMNLDGTGYSNAVRIRLNCTIVVNVCFHSFSWHLCMASKWQLFPAAKSFLVALAVGRRQCEYIMDGF